MDIRKNIYSLTDTELANFKQALNNMKASGAYDEFVKRHHMAMMSPTLLPGETGTARNAAHRGPSFLPWHRVFVREFELALQAALPGAGVTLPYWDWVTDAPLGKNAPLWNTNPALGKVYVGGDGLVNSGPFASWVALIENPVTHAFVPRQPPGLRRDLGAGSPILPTQATVDSALAIAEYDHAPYSEAQQATPSFRNRLEGWLLQPGETGTQNHNLVHVWTGGDMLPGTSPNDPVFFLHHCNIDRIWAQWQATHPIYAPASGGPPQHNLNDPMSNLLIPSTPAQTLPYSASFNYTYDLVKPIVTSLSFIEVFTDFTHYLPAVFEVTSYQPVTLALKPGSVPQPPFGTALFNPVLVVPPTNGKPASAYFWFTCHPTDDSPVPLQTVTLVRTDTGEELQITLTATAVSVPYLANVLVLDQSGSMDLPAGESGVTRLTALRQAAAAFLALVPQDNAVGIASFATDAQKQFDVATFGDAGPNDTNRQAQLAFLQAYDNIDEGTTAIGKGVQKGKELLDAAVLSPDFSYSRSLIVVTDGIENVHPYIEEMIDTVNDHVYAIGLGTAQQVSTKALTQLTESVGGYCLLTGQLTPDTEDYFRLTKYFVQILVDLTESEVAEDPCGFLLPGATARIPFLLNEADFKGEVVLLTELPVIDLEIEAPSGEILPAQGPGVSFGAGPNVRFGRLSLPVPLAQGPAHAGTWHARLKMDSNRYQEQVRDLCAPDALRRLHSHGVRYSLNVHTTSNLRARAQASQRSFLPGEDIHLRMVLTEYGMALGGRATVLAEMQRPDGTRATLPLVESEPGVFEARTPAVLSGVYRFRLLASGKTLHGNPFKRERLITGAVWQGSDQPDTDPEAKKCRRQLCRWMWTLVLLGAAALLVLLIVLLALIL
jgi:hypothetical protein